jgi:hypothetical protein
VVDRAGQPDVGRFGGEVVAVNAEEELKGNSRSLTTIAQRFYVGRSLRPRGWIPFLRQGRRDDVEGPERSR